jgi:hypothetical protein
MNKILDHLKLDRSAIRISTLGDEPNDSAYWADKTPAERFAAMEYLRVINYGYDPTTERLQRVLTMSRL